MPSRATRAERVIREVTDSEHLVSPTVEAHDWLGLRSIDPDAGTWHMEVTEGVLAGSSSLYGGCGTAAAMAVAATMCEHPVRWASTHFTGLAPGGSSVELRARPVSAGRTVSHVAVDADASGERPCFASRVMLGERAPIATGALVPRPSVPPVEECGPFEIGAHEATFAERFEWRLAHAGGDGTAAWWVHPHDLPLSSALVGAVLCDYLTYGIGRAAHRDVGGLSVDNVVRLHHAAPVEGWVLLQVVAEAFDGGFASGSARVWRSDGTLLCTGSQTMVLNPWDWRQAGE